MIWYEDEVKTLKNKILTYDSKPVTLFYGSSSIRLWQKLESDFLEFNAVNLGFGGSTLAACVHFFSQIIVPYNPSKIVLYAGDNDLGDGQSPEDVFNSYKQFENLVSIQFPEVPIYFISIKPSLIRYNIKGKILHANKLIRAEISKHPNHRFIDVYSYMVDAEGYPKKNLFEDDGLHINSAGYELWKNIIFSSLTNDLIFS